MAFTQFPREQYFRVLGTDQNTRMGYFNLQDGTELKHMMVTLFVKGLIPAPFDLWVNIYGNDTLIDPIFSSVHAEISMDTLVPTYVNNWLGNVYLDFSGNPLNPNINYFMTMETSGYTRDLDDYYVGYNLDWYSEVNNQLSLTEAGARIRILGRR